MESREFSSLVVSPAFHMLGGHCPGQCRQNGQRPTQDVPLGGINAAHMEKYGAQNIPEAALLKGELSARLEPSLGVGVEDSLNVMERF